MTASKYPHVAAKLNEIQKWTREGLTESQIAKNLGISRSTFNEYKRLHPELAKALDQGRELCIAELENALYKRAVGFEYEEVKTYVKFEDGKEVKYQERTRKFCPPHVGACALLLKNKDRDGNNGQGWSDDPMKRDLEKAWFELRKEMESMKSW